MAAIKETEIELFTALLLEDLSIKPKFLLIQKGDHFRTRITHSLEVAQIARTLAKHFNLNEDLCETLGLSHDLGHTPFGHTGEDALE